MEKRTKIGFGIFVLLFAAIVYLEANQPEPINWNPSYAHHDKIPLGSFVLFESLKEKYPGKLHKTKRPPFKFLENDSLNGTYFFLNQHVAFGSAELKKVLDWTAKGNTVFISAKYLGKQLLDTLKLETDNAFSYETLKKEPLLNFTNPSFERDSAYHFQHNTDLTYFSKIDTASQTILGSTEYFEGKNRMKNSLVNFIEAPFGKGKIILHLFPEAFSNYFILAGNNAEYAEKALAYLNFQEPVFWDSHYKVGKAFQTSPLYILLGNKYLKWAYYFVLIGALLFVLFEGKRKQKSIEIRPPLTNKTHEFTRAVAGIYLEEKQHKTIATKKIHLFLEYIRSHFRVNTQEINTEFLKILSERSATGFDSTRELFVYISEIQKKTQLKKEELMKLNRLISNFKKNA
ncbi:MAG TPA: DUF4350 domain-containing protein [Flavobacteriaceae bacterium]|nr:DUF4350 domain-containing protein [Flavobacteriaceae bacterium]